MESKDRSKSPLLYIILIISVFNTCATLYLVTQTRSAGHAARDTTVIPLPKDLDSKSERTELYDAVVDRYNDKDADGLYALFDDSVRVEISEESFKNTLNNIYGLTGFINSGAYSTYEGNSNPGGVNSYILYYRINTEEGTGTLKVFVFNQGDEEYRISGFRFDMD